MIPGSQSWLPHVSNRQMCTAGAQVVQIRITWKIPIGLNLYSSPKRTDATTTATQRGNARFLPSFTIAYLSAKFLPAQHSRTNEQSPNQPSTLLRFSPVSEPWSPIQSIVSSIALPRRRPSTRQSPLSGHPLPDMLGLRLVSVITAFASTVAAIPVVSVAQTSLTVPGPITITWTDDGTSPALSTFTTCSIYLWFGGNVPGTDSVREHNDTLEYMSWTDFGSNLLETSLVMPSRLRRAHTQALYRPVMLLRQLPFLMDCKHHRKISDRVDHCGLMRSAATSRSNSPTPATTLAPHFPIASLYRE